MDANLINRSAAKDIKAPQNQATQHQLTFAMRSPKPLCCALDLKFDQRHRFWIFKICPKLDWKCIYIKQLTEPQFLGGVGEKKWSPFLDLGVRIPIFLQLSMATFGNYSETIWEFLKKLMTWDTAWGGGLSCPEINIQYTIHGLTL